MARFVPGFQPPPRYRRLFFLFFGVGDQRQERRQERVIGLALSGLGQHGVQIGRHPQRTPTQPVGPRPIRFVAAGIEKKDLPVDGSFGVSPAIPQEFQHQPVVDIAAVLGLHFDGVGGTAAAGGFEHMVCPPFQVP